VPNAVSAAWSLTVRLTNQLEPLYFIAARIVAAGEDASSIDRFGYVGGVNPIRLLMTEQETLRTNYWRCRDQRLLVDRSTRCRCSAERRRILKITRRLCSRFTMSGVS